MIGASSGIFCYLSALGEHVAGAQRIRQLILYARDNNIDERRILSDTLKLSVKIDRALSR